MPGTKNSILPVFVILAVTIIVLGLMMVLVLKFFRPSSGPLFGEKIGVITIKGAIGHSQPTVSQLVEFRKNDDIRAIILRIDSPGGGVGPSQEIYREINKTKEKKKVVASLGSMAASGGYYIASAADRIVANPGTITGSIGVLMEFVLIEDLLKKIGVELEVLKSGEFKDIGSPHRRISERDRELLSKLIEDIRQQFIQAVAQGRKLSVESVSEFADARIITGKKAKELGLVDVLGNFEDAVSLTKKMTGIRGDVSLVYARKGRSALWEYLFEDAAGALYRMIRNQTFPRIEYRWNGFSSNND